MTAPSMSACSSYPVAARPPDPARRLEQDLCDDRLAAWAMACGRRRLFAAAERLAINCHSCVNAAAQFAGIAALTGPREPVARMVAAFAERREMIVAALNGLPGFRCARPGGAFYAFPNVTGTGLDARALQGAAARRGRRGDHRRHQLWRVRRGLSAILLCQQPRGDRRGDRAHPPATWQNPPAPKRSS